MSKVKITNHGIKRALNHISVEEAVTEYIWNGFDAKATLIEILYKTHGPFKKIKEFTISDNGKGIDHSLLSKKFTPFLESEKALKRIEDNIALEGKNGYGRLTFFKFAQFAHWQTVYTDVDKNYSYNIDIKADTLDEYQNSNPSETNETQTGTQIKFSNLLFDFDEIYLEKKLKPFLTNEFAWYLEINKSKGLKISINGKFLDYESLISERTDFEYKWLEDKGAKDPIVFECQYVQWNAKLNDEFSRFYFMNEENKLKRKETTRLNKKGDQFYHSIIIKSAFFDNFVFYEEENQISEKKLTLFSGTSNYKAFRDLINYLNIYLKNKRKPFLHTSAKVLISTYEEEKVMPLFGNNAWDKIRKNEFEVLVKELYEVEPALFVKLNTEQKKTFLNLLNLLLDSDERDNLFIILQDIVELDSKDRAQLEKILETTKLTNIIQALKLVHDRIIAIKEIKELVFNHEFRANERDHLQKAIEGHYWIFGEEYNLICAAEAKFEKALRKYLYLLRGIEETIFINHPDKLKEMDIFLVRQNYKTDKINHVILELKSPTTIKKLTNKELAQVKMYMNVILKVDEFNAETNSSWDFYLIGQDYDDAIANEIKNAQHHGEKDLAFKVNNYKIFVKRWSEVFIDVELRLNWLNKKLQIEREKLSSTPKPQLGKTIDILKTSSANQPSEVLLPSEK